MAHPEYDILEFGIKGKREITFAEHTYHDARRYWLEEKGYEHSYAWNKIYRRHLFTDISFPKGVVFEDVATRSRTCIRGLAVSDTLRMMPESWFWLLSTVCALVLLSKQ